VAPSAVVELSTSRRVRAGTPRPGDDTAPRAAVVPARTSNPVRPDSRNAFLVRVVMSKRITRSRRWPPMTARPLAVGNPSNGIRTLPRGDTVHAHESIEHVAADQEVRPVGVTSRTT
jgi:hypothetical protein